MKLITTLMLIAVAISTCSGESLQQAIKKKAQAATVPPTPLDTSNMVPEDKLNKELRKTTGLGLVAELEFQQIELWDEQCFLDRFSAALEAAFSGDDRKKSFVANLLKFIYEDVEAHGQLHWYQLATTVGNTINSQEPEVRALGKAIRDVVIAVVNDTTQELCPPRERPSIVV